MRSSDSLSEKTAEGSSFFRINMAIFPFESSFITVIFAEILNRLEQHIRAVDDRFAPGEFAGMVADAFHRRDKNHRRRNTCLHRLRIMPGKAKDAGMLQMKCLCR